MSKKIILLTILIIFVSFSICFAIDENQFITTTNVATEGNEADDYSGIPDSDALSAALSAEETSENVQSDQSTETVGSFDSEPTTTVSRVSSSSNVSTISNILNIVLIVVGILLVFLAIAILIRLH